MSSPQEIRVTLEQEEDYSFRVRFDESTLADLITDEGPPLGGGKGPGPSRLLLAAVANCLSSSLLFAMRKFHNQPGQLRAEAVTQVVRNADGRRRIESMAIELHLAESAGAHQQVPHLMEQFEDFCVVTQSVRAGIAVSVVVKDADGVGLHTS